MAAAKDGLRVCSPLTGQAVPLEQVPDEVFSQKVLGDGLAIIPVDGNIYSPVDGEVSSVRRRSTPTASPPATGWRSWSTMAWKP